MSWSQFCVVVKHASRRILYVNVLYILENIFRSAPVSERKQVDNVLTWSLTPSHA